MAKLGWVQSEQILCVALIFITELWLSLPPALALHFLHHRCWKGSTSSWPSTSVPTIQFAPCCKPVNSMLIFSAPVLQEVEPVGRWFEAYISRSRKNVSLSNSEPGDDEHLEENVEDKKESSSSSSDSEDERYLLTLDPKEWKVVWQLLRIYTSLLLVLTCHFQKQPLKYVLLSSLFSKCFLW